MPTAPANTVLVGVPETTPLTALIVMPAGSPVALHVKLDPVLPVCVKVAPPCTGSGRDHPASTLALTVMAGQATVSVKFCTASGLTPLVAVNCSGNVPVCVAVPARTFVGGVNVTPVGSAPPVCDTVGAGKPVVATVNVPGVPTMKVVLLALVIAGGALTDDGEGLRRVRQRAVGRRERDRERSALRRRARQHPARGQRDARWAARRW